MSVDYIPCSVCGTVFCECGHCGFCEGCSSDLCGNCYDEAVEKYGEEDGEYLIKCQICQKDVISDLEVLIFVLKKFKVSRKLIEKEIRKK